MIQNWRKNKNSIYCFVVLLQYFLLQMVKGNEIQVKITHQFVDKKLSVLCIANGTSAKEIPGAKFLMSDGKTEWETSLDRRIIFEKKVDLVTYVEYLNITWDPVLKEDQYSFSGTCQAGSNFASFYLEIPANSWFEYCSNKFHQFKSVIIACAVSSFALVVLLVVVVLVLRRRKSRNYHKMDECEDEASSYPNQKQGHLIY